MNPISQLFHETKEFVRKGLDDDSPELLPRVVVTGALFAVAWAIHLAVPDHDPANSRRAA